MTRGRHAARHPWACELDGRRPAPGGRADRRQELDDGRRRVRDQPVGGAHHPQAGGDGRAEEVSTSSSSRAAQVPTTSTMASRPPTFVEVHLVGRAPVEPALGRRQGLERGLRPLADAVREAGLLPRGRRCADAVPDHGGLARRGRALRGGDAAPQHRLGLEIPTASRGGAGHHGAHLVDVGTGVEQRAERHVAGHAGEAVEPGDRGSPGRADAPYPAGENIDGAGGAVAVVDADHGEAGGAGRQHRQQGGHPSSAGAVARRWWARRRRGAGSSRRPREASAPSMPATTTTRVGVGELVDGGEEAGGRRRRRRPSAGPARSRRPGGRWCTRRRRGGRPCRRRR